MNATKYHSDIRRPTVSNTKQHGRSSISNPMDASRQIRLLQREEQQIHGRQHQGDSRHIYGWRTKGKGDD